MGKDQGYISREVKLLKELGIIDLTADKSEGREKLVPVLKYGRVIFDVGLDDLIEAKKVSNQ